MANKDFVKIELTEESRQTLRKLAQAGKVDLKPTLEVIGNAYRKEVKMIFDHQQPRDVGLRWSPLSPIYAKWKEKHYPNQPILQRTGDLYRSMTRKGAKGNITLIGKIGAVFGSSIPYGVYHDELDAPRSKMPLRNFSEVGDRRRKIIIEQLESAIVRNFERNGIEVEQGIFAL